ncbi:hypothetical protein WISP_41624 [Willisornis vidua]|uniref:Uncharacterized protein n=1 Tax=Willisornis vidua TaxID=1566151 RepID=A0ABQ9DMQ8_9PASS|nr:hypothetical protein WISP_41624 [Willisornis vidua]
MKHSEKSSKNWFAKIYLANSSHNRIPEAPIISLASSDIDAMDVVDKDMDMDMDTHAKDIDTDIDFMDVVERDMYMDMDVHAKGIDTDFMDMVGMDRMYRQISVGTDHMDIDTDCMNMDIDYMEMVINYTDMYVKDMGGATDGTTDDTDKEDMDIDNKNIDMDIDTVERVVDTDMDVHAKDTDRVLDFMDMDDMIWIYGQFRNQSIKGQRNPKGENKVEGLLMPLVVNEDKYPSIVKIAGMGETVPSF